MFYHEPSTTITDQRNSWAEVDYLPMALSDSKLQTGGHLLFVMAYVNQK